MDKAATAEVLATPALKAPTRKQLKHMSKEEVEAWQQQYIAEQHALFANFDADKVARDDLISEEMMASLCWKDVSFSIQLPDPANKKQKIDKVLLEKCFGNVEAGSLVAVMGPSGCGKSTLLDILAQKKTAPHEGEIYLNGHNVKGNKLFRRIAAYVGQEDVMPEHWTPREAVEFNGRLKKDISHGMKKEIIDKQIDSLLEDVGLLHVADTKIGGASVRGLSGGQKRRVTLARGLAANPRLMFCDEPTSGLSSTDAEACIKTLKVMSKKWGVTILVVIHQPRVEVANLFTHLIALTAQPGRVVYNGLMRDLTAHCSTV